jgi:hypothetical protein
LLARAIREIEKMARKAVDSNELFIDGLEFRSTTGSATKGRASESCFTA